MKKITQLIVAICLCFGVTHVLAQCPSGEVEVEIKISTDQYASEGYWELVPTGNSCGVGIIASGGNPAVGCNGGGTQTNPSGGYAGNQTITEGPWCLTEGVSYDIIYVDNWGDGGFEFDVAINGYSTNSFDAVTGSNLTFTFLASEPLTYDLGMHSLSSPYLYDEVGALTISGVYFNFGAETVTTVDINYQIDSKPIETMSLTGLNIQNFENSTFSHTTPWNATVGTYNLKVWASNINGNPDLNTSNDAIERTIEIGNGVPNIIDLYVNAVTTTEEIANSTNSISRPMDLDFHPSLNKKQLWVINKGIESTGGNTVIIDNAGESNQTSQMKKDGNSWHFMSLPTGIAFGRNGNFGTSPGVFDANHNGGGAFTGPSLWSGDLSIYAEPSGGNGSHLDMLHVSPYSQGIASETDNVYWVFDGFNNDIVRYDFVEDHGPGNAFHGDAKIRRYSDFSVAKDPNRKVPSHLVVSGDWLYVVDYGNKKVFRIDITTGSIGNTPTYGPFESVAEYKYVTGYTAEDVVTTGLTEPTGIDVIGNRMIVSDYATGEILLYDISTMPATKIGAISTTAQGIMGVKIGPIGQIWYVDYEGKTVNVIKLGPAGIKKGVELANITLFPNPTNNQLTVRLPNTNTEDYTITVYTTTGKAVYQTVIKSNSMNISTSDWASGIYNVHITNGDNYYVQKVIVQH